MKPTHGAGDLVMQFFGDTRAEMLRELDRLGLSEGQAESLLMDAAISLERHRRDFELLAVSAAQAAPELAAFGKAIDRALRSLRASGAPGYARLARAYALERDSQCPGAVEGWTPLLRLAADLMAAKGAAAAAATIPTNFFALPEGQKAILAGRKQVKVDFLGELDEAFKRYAGSPAPRSEYAGRKPYPWFNFCRLAAAPLGAPETNGGFRRLFRLAAKAHPKNL